MKSFAILIGMPQKKLEHYKYFEPFAWTLCISFAGFVGLLALQVNDTITELEMTNLTFEARLKSVEEAVNVNPPAADLNR